jgi:hypothetical protein
MESEKYFILSFFPHMPLANWKTANSGHFLKYFLCGLEHSKGTFCDIENPVITISSFQLFYFCCSYWELLPKICPVLNVVLRLSENNQELTCEWSGSN